MQLHHECEPLAFLLGTWRGPGDGHYPTIESFQYNEEVTFAHVGKPFLTYSQKTRDRGTGEPLHAETGYLRPVAGQRVELVLAQPSGIVELHQGALNGTVIDFSLDGVHATGTAKSVTDVHRSIRVDADILSYDVSMAAVGQSMTHHLSARLVRQSDD